MTTRGTNTPIRYVSDDVWDRLNPIFARYDPPKPNGRKRIDQRAAFNAVLFHFGSGCPWSELPEEFPAPSSVQRTFKRWKRISVLDRILAVLAAGYHDPSGPNRL